MREIISRPDQAESPKSERLALRAAESPTFGQLFRGEAIIERVGGEPALMRRQDDVLCTVSTHAVTFPGLRPDGSDWDTHLSIWTLAPIERNDRWGHEAQEDVTILTGEGEMLFSVYPEVNEAVTAEIHRQEDESTDLEATP